MNVNEPRKVEKNWEKQNEDYKKLINKKYDKSNIKNILSDVIGFHKREDSVFWQDFFNRSSTKNDEDLIEDAKCIGDMERISEKKDESDKKGFRKIYTYKFLKQDYKIKENENVLKALETDLEKNKVGKVVKINESNNEEDLIEIASKEDLPKKLSI